MISIVFGLLLLGGVYKVYSSFIGGGFENLAKSKLHSEVNVTMQQITRDLRRATGEISEDNSFDWDAEVTLKVNNPDGEGNVITPGNPGSFPAVSTSDIGPILGVGPEHGNGRVQITYYSGTGASALGITLVPFTNMPGNRMLSPGEWFVAEPGIYKIGEPLRLLNPGTSNNGSCVLFAYDKNKDDLINTDAGNDERFGYRLTSIGDIGTIEKRTGGDYSDCDSGTWVAMTDSNLVNITNLHFSMIESSVTGNNGGTIKRIKFYTTITGNLMANSAISKTIDRTVYLRNEQYEA